MYENDEHGIGVEKIPYIPVKLTQREFEKVKDKKIQIYNIEGQELFQERDREGNVVGYVFYVMWRA